MSGNRNVVVPGPQAPRVRRSVFARVFYPLFLLIAVAGICGGVALGYGYMIYTADGPLPDKKVFEVARGLDLSGIGASLEQGGIISDDRVFVAAAVLSGRNERLKAGEYEFPGKATIRQVLDIIASGKAIMYKLSVPEGWTTWQALNRVRENDVLTGDLTVAPAEGAILPDTYLFRRGKTRDELVNDMVAAQDKLLADSWNKRSPEVQLRSPEEAVTLASIVEKETARPDERPRIAAVFFNRMKLGMRLQSDPTTIYGITHGQGKLDRALTRNDIDTWSIYNTYRFAGLPPGPIANPGRMALEAVLNPIQTKELYFVADGTGGHAFAETLDQHNDNVSKWRKVSQEDSQMPPPLAVQPDENAPVPGQKVGVTKSPEVPAAAVTSPPTVDGVSTIPEPLPAPKNVPPLAVANPAEVPVDTPPVAAKPEVKAPPVVVAAPEAAPPQKPVPAQKPLAPAVPVTAEKPAIAAAVKPSSVPGEKPAGKPVTAKTDTPAPPTPVEKPALAKKPAVATLDDAAVPPAKPLGDPTPGTLIKVAKRLVPIPVPKPK